MYALAWGGKLKRPLLGGRGEGGGKGTERRECYQLSSTTQRFLKTPCRGRKKDQGKGERKTRLGNVLPLHPPFLPERGGDPVWLPTLDGEKEWTNLSMSSSYSPSSTCTSPAVKWKEKKFETPLPSGDASLGEKEKGSFSDAGFSIHISFVPNERLFEEEALGGCYRTAAEIEELKKKKRPLRDVLKLYASISLTFCREDSKRKKNEETSRARTSAVREEKKKKKERPSRQRTQTLIFFFRILKLPEGRREDSG